ncbi:MAG: Crp/Fnr family transcriptional regulator [Cyanobacteria bacterium J06627_8]
MPQSVTVDQLQHLPLFEDLALPLVENLASHSQLTHHEADTVVFYEGDDLPECLHLLMSGRLRMGKVAASGKETILRILPAGEIFAAPAIFGNGKAPATATALESSTVIMLEKHALLDSFTQTPELAMHLLGIFNERLQRLHNQVHGLASEKAIVRLVHYLEYAIEHTGSEVVEAGEQMRSHLSHYQIARSIGITYEECVRLFKQLSPIVTYQRGGIITVSNRQKLSDLGKELGECC